jgi:LPXTG-motif cell wall-anchored protein
VVGPEAKDDTYAVPAGMFYSIPASLGVLSNDTNVPPGTIASWQQPPPAGLTLNDDGGITWAVPNTPGVYTFPYCVLAFPADPGRRSCISEDATVTLTVATPVAVDDAYTVAPGASLTVPAPGVLGNDTGVPTGTIASWQQPPPTGLALNDDGGITWTAPTTPGVFTFPYCIVAFADSPERRCVSNDATVTVTVTAPPTTPATPVTPADPNLPQTGTSIWLTVTIGLVLVGAGACALVLGRRRRA